MPSLLHFIRMTMPLLFVVFALQLEFMQMGAWATMIRDYSQGRTLKVAVAETFSGERPCEKCNKLMRSQTGTSTPSEITASSSIPPEVECPEVHNLPTPPPGAGLISSTYSLKSKTLSFQPPTPPPRFFLS